VVQFLRELFEWDLQRFYIIESFQRWSSRHPDRTFVDHTSKSRRPTRCQSHRVSANRSTPISKEKRESISEYRTLVVLLSDTRVSSRCQMCRLSINGSTPSSNERRVLSGGLRVHTVSTLLAHVPFPTSLCVKAVTSSQTTPCLLGLHASRRPTRIKRYTFVATAISDEVSC
jgi:hypothetical protein